MDNSVCVFNRRVSKAAQPCSIDRRTGSRDARNRKLNVRLIKFAFVMFVMLLSSSVFGLVKSYAGTGAGLNGYKKVFISAEIKNGHDIYDIARENLPDKAFSEKDSSYMDAYISEVTRINHIYDLSKLDAGNHIIVPSYR